MLWEWPLIQELFLGEKTPGPKPRTLFLLGKLPRLGYRPYLPLLWLDKIFREFNLIFLIKIQSLMSFAFSITPLSFFHTEKPSPRLLNDLGNDRIMIAR